MTPVSIIQLPEPHMNTRVIAEQFVRARLRAEALSAFPGEMPTTLDEAYAIQGSAIGLWPDRVAGWKVGRIDPPWSDRLGEDRLVGPIFSQALWAGGAAGAAGADACVAFPVFEGGFAAVEAEFVFRLQADAPPDKTSWTAQE